MLDFPVSPVMLLYNLYSLCNEIFYTRTIVLGVKAGSKGREPFRRPLRVTRAPHLRHPLCHPSLRVPSEHRHRLKAVSAWCQCLADAVPRHDG